MGGNALSVTTSRLAKEEYKNVCADVLERLEKALPNHRKTIIESYREKPDFGDLDVLIEGGDGYDPLAISQALQATEVVRNGDCTSIGVNTESGIFQVDLIKSAPESFEFASHYFAFNDLGNLLGRVAHKSGFKLGHLGLLYVLREEGNSSQVVAELVVTHDWNKAIEFLGYDVNRYEQGFESLKEIFEFAITSRFSNKDVYLLENVNAVSRIRDRKRKTYTEFLLWLETSAASDMPRFDWSDKAATRIEILEHAKVVFPEFKQSYENAMVRWERELKMKGKFNGQMVGQITGLNGKELGAFIKDFKAQFGSDSSFKDWVLDSNSDAIEAKVKALAGA